MPLSYIWHLTLTDTILVIWKLFTKLAKFYCQRQKDHIYWQQIKICATNFRKLPIKSKMWSESKTWVNIVGLVNRGFVTLSSRMVFKVWHIGISWIDRYDRFLFSHRIGGVMVSVLASSAVDHGFKSQLGQIKDYVKWYLLLLC